MQGKQKMTAGKIDGASVRKSERTRYNPCREASVLSKESWIQVRRLRIQIEKASEWIIFLSKTW
jgi:hypothetical protein